MARDQLVKKLYTDARGYEYALIHLDALVVDFKNPRIPPQESALESMLHLLKEDPESMLNLATDIVAEGGTNPAELLNVTAEGPSFVVREGNRRITVRKILRNPEQLRGHRPDPEFRRWTALSKKAGKSLPARLVCVIGEDHERWVDRRHLGPQGGRGLVPWNAEAKRRRDHRRTGEQDLAIHVLDALKDHDPDRFGGLEPPKRTFTTFARVIESEAGRLALGLEADDGGRILLKHGERSLHLLAHILNDLRKTGREKLTSRTIHTSTQIATYLDKAKMGMPRGVSGTPITFGKAADAGTQRGSADAGDAKTRTKIPDVMRAMTKPTERRLQRMFEELAKSRRLKMHNAAIILTRVLLELSVDAYANKQKLPFAGDVDPTLAGILPAFYGNAGRDGFSIPKEVKAALAWAKKKPMPLTEKLSAVIDHLVKLQIFNQKDAVAKKRELKDGEILPILNDAVHRLDNVPSIARVDHILEAVLPVYNGMLKD